MMLTSIFWCCVSSECNARNWNVDRFSNARCLIIQTGESFDSDPLELTLDVFAAKVESINTSA